MLQTRRNDFDIIDDISAFWGINLNPVEILDDYFDIVNNLSALQSREDKEPASILLFKILGSYHSSSSN